MDLRTAIQRVIAHRASLADIGAMNLNYQWDATHVSAGKRPSYGRIDPALNPLAVAHVADVCNVSPEDAATILDVWNVLAFGYDEGFAHGAGENDPATDTDLSQYDIWQRLDEPGEVVFTHAWEPDTDSEDKNDPWCATCGERYGDQPNQHGAHVFTSDEEV